MTPRVTVEDRWWKATIPDGSIFKGHVISAFRTSIDFGERDLLPARTLGHTDGRTILAPLPEGIDGHFGPELRRFVLMHYQGQSTLPLLVTLLRSLGVSISKRQVQRLLIEKHEWLHRGSPRCASRRA